MSRRSRHPAPLAIRELAVDPADVDRETYPVWIRLTRRLTPHEARALAGVDPHLVAEGDAVLVPDARLDDVAHAHGEWQRRLETVERLGEELDGETTLANERLLDERARQGSHLANQHLGDRGLH
jgi:hypothetical protein